MVVPGLAMTSVAGFSPDSSCPKTACPDGPGVRRQIVLVTGMSGAGLSTTLKSLEDLGFEAVDNLRLSLLSALVDQADKTDGRRPLAIGIDSRTRDFSDSAFIAEHRRLAARADLEVRLLFLDCVDEALQRRFTETRRRHPLATDRPVAAGIAHERELLARVRERADLVIDSSNLSIHDLKRLLAGHFPLEAESALQVFVMSFSYRQGLPREADLVFDVRFLTNPHWDPGLRPLDGGHPAVAAMIAQDRDFGEFFRRLTELLEPLLPRYRQEGKSYLTIAIGCSGGRHRSVYVAERLAAWMGGRGIKVGLRHRDLERKDVPPG